MSPRAIAAWVGVAVLAGVLTLAAAVNSSPRPQSLAPPAAIGATSELPSIIRSPQLDSATPPTPEAESSATPGVTAEGDQGPGRAIAFGIAAFAVVAAVIALWWGIGEWRRRGGASREPQ